ncbi:MAG: S41 family peptidase [bacterium]|nr:S41 family peptidase [bacterium]
MVNERKTRRIFNFSLGIALALAFLFGFQVHGVFKLLENQDKLPVWLSRASSVFSYGLQANAEGFSEADLGVLKEVLALISETYLHRDDINAEDVIHGAASGAVASLGDRYSRFVPPPDQQVLTEEIEGAYAGVGISIIDRPGVLPPYALPCEIANGADEYNINFVSQTTGVIVVQVFETGPAFEVGIQPNDVILCVEGTNLRGGTADDAVAVLKGPENTDVNITLWRPSIQDSVTFDVTRKIVQVPTVGAKEMLTGEIGYIRLDSFNNVSPADVRTAVNDLLFQGMKGLIFDLRNNTGGPMTAAQQIADVFISDGVMVYYEDTTGHIEAFPSNDGGGALNLPLILLVNGNSASASEIVAGAVRDTHTGLLLGETTFGKGVVQNVYTLQDRSGLVLTTGRYLTPGHHEITSEGLTPDIEYPLDPESLRVQDPAIGDFMDRLDGLNLEYTQLREEMYTYLQDHDYQRDAAEDVMTDWIDTGEPPAEFAEQPALDSTGKSVVESDNVSAGEGANESAVEGASESNGE